MDDQINNTIESQPNIENSTTDIENFTNNNTDEHVVYDSTDMNGATGKCDKLKRKRAFLI